MNKEVLMVMQRLYAGSREPVLILDKDWNVVWSSDGTRVSALPELLGLPEGCWENETRPLMLGETMYTCRLCCSAQDGLRTAILTHGSQPMDLRQLSEQIHSMFSVCTALEAELDSMGIYEERELLNALAGNILRTYRPVFLRREIERGMDGMWSNEVFCLQTALTESFGKLPALLRDTADIVIELGDGKQFVRGDADGFRCAVLAAMLLCIRDPELTQSISVRVAAREDKAELEISAAPTKEKRRDAREQSLSSSCRTRDDRELLELYCRTFGIGLFFAAEQGSETCRLVIPVCTETASISLGAPRAGGAEGYFDLVPVMMAGFRVRKRF